MIINELTDEKKRYRKLPTWLGSFTDVDIKSQYSTIDISQITETNRRSIQDTLDSIISFEYEMLNSRLTKVYSGKDLKKIANSYNAGKVWRSNPKSE